MASTDSSPGPRWLDAWRRAHARLWLGPPAGAIPSERYAAVIMKPDGIGDFILALSAIRLVLRHYGEEHCALLIAPSVVELAQVEFPRATCIAVPPFSRHKRALSQWRPTRRRLAEVACETLVCLRHQRWDYHELMLSWVCCQRRLILDDARAAAWTIGRNSFSYECAGRIAWSEPDPVSSLLAGGGCDCRELRMHGHLVTAVVGARPAAEDMLPRFLQLAPPASPSGTLIAPLTAAAIKDLPVEWLEDLARRKIFPAGQAVVLTGSRTQAAALEKYRRALQRGGCADVQVETAASLAGFVRRVAAAGIVLAADTATAHLATALDRPTVVAMGGGHCGQFAPWRRSARQIWLTHRLDCFGCGWRCPYPAPYCLTRIAAEQVGAAIRAVLGRAEGTT